MLVPPVVPVCEAYHLAHDEKMGAASHGVAKLGVRAVCIPLVARQESLLRVKTSRRLSGRLRSEPAATGAVGCMP
jgi:hypothetical protein